MHTLTFLYDFNGNQMRRLIASVLRGDMAMLLTELLDAKSICAMYSVCKEMRLQTSSLATRNEVWRMVYRRDYASLTTSPLSTHKHVICMNRVNCRVARHYTRLVRRKSGFIEFKNFFHQYVSRTMTRISNRQTIDSRKELRAHKNRLQLYETRVKRLKNALLKDRKRLRDRKSALECSLAHANYLKQIAPVSEHRLNLAEMFLPAMQWAGDL
jgi:hypothetical protein